MRVKKSCTFAKAIEYIYSKEGNTVIVETTLGDKFAYRVSKGRMVSKSDTCSSFVTTLILTKATIEGLWSKVIDKEEGIC